MKARCPDFRHIQEQRTGIYSAMSGAYKIQVRMLRAPVFNGISQVIGNVGKAIRAVVTALVAVGVYFWLSGSLYFRVLTV